MSQASRNPKWRIRIKCPGCASSKTISYTEEEIEEYKSKDTKIKCPSCGIEYRVVEALLAVFLEEKRRRSPPVIPRKSIGLTGVVAFQIATELGNLLVNRGIIPKSEFIGILDNLRRGLSPADNSDVIAVRELLQALIRRL